MEYQLNVWAYGLPRGLYMSTFGPENRGWTYRGATTVLEYVLEYLPVLGILLEYYSYK